MEGKIQKSTKLYTSFWVREKEKKFFRHPALSYHLLHEARKYEEVKEEKKTAVSYERSNVCKHLLCMW